MKSLCFSVCFCLFFLVLVSFNYGQDRGSIPETLLRPSRGESPRYPADLIIGELGQGRASAAAYSFANSAASALLSRNRGHSSLSTVSADSLNSYFERLAKVSPSSFRIGGGREEADGAVSFLIRYIGRDYGLTGELYVRYAVRQVLGEDGEITQTGYWVIDDLLFEEIRSREDEYAEATKRAKYHRLDYLPYERFF